MRVFAFTLDIDWATEEVIYEITKIFSEHKIKCTLFCTHKSDVLSNIDAKLFEIALHPNYNSIFGNKPESIHNTFDKLHSIFPQARGVRAHSGTQSSVLSEFYVSRGIKYESNIISPYCSHLKPFKLWNGLYRIPFNWEDDVHYLYGHSFKNCKMNLSNRYLIFNFHPIHIYLNTENEERYKSAKEFYHYTSKLKPFINTSEIKGTKDLLLDLMMYVKRNNIKAYKLSEIIKHY
ncbi:MAG: hypothetical protein ACOYN6_15785 [Ignavibacteria bacterium]